MQTYNSENVEVKGIFGDDTLILRQYADGSQAVAIKYADPLASPRSVVLGDEQLHELGYAIAQRLAEKGLAAPLDEGKPQSSFLDEQIAPPGTVELEAITAPPQEVTIINNITHYHGDVS